MNFALKLVEQELQVILNALAELPFKISNDIITGIMKQVTEQQLAAKQTEAAPAE